jgi:hypothetical protein
MLRRFILAAVAVAITMTFAYSDEFLAKITKVDGTKVTYQKGTKNADNPKKMDYADATTTDLAKASVFKKGFDKDAKKAVKGDAIDKGLANDMFTTISEKGLAATFITDDKGAVTEIWVGGGKKKN